MDVCRLFYPGDSGGERILYIHGFASCGDSKKTRILKEYFGVQEVLAPDLPVSPDEAVATLCTLIEQKRVKLLIGSSLGGYYAVYLAALYGLKSVLINPSTKPYETLEPFVGMNTRWCDGAPFRWERTYLKALEKYEVVEEGGNHRFENLCDYLGHIEAFCRSGSDTAAALEDK